MTIYTGDCVQVMRTMPSESIDAIVTDPPAGIRFMSKNWDHDKGGRTQWVAWMTEVMVECYRLLKPGGYAVVWSLPRTCHWTGWAMEDAGWIIRDELTWVYASGFPKGKANLKPAHEPIVLARKPGPLRALNIDATRIGTEQTYSLRTEGEDGTSFPRFGKPPGIYPSDAPGRWPSNLLLSDPELFDVANPGVVGSGASVSSGLATRRSPGDHYSGGWPGSEDVEATYGDSGGYSRFFAIPRRDVPAMTKQCKECGREFSLDYPRDAQDWHYGYECEARDPGLPEPYPRHFIVPKADRADREPVLRGQLDGQIKASYSGGVSGTSPRDDNFRSKDPRENLHPTVKPTDLMRHLVRLVTPQGGTVLDCFLGSGSTAIACELEGFPWLGIEQDPGYVAIAEARLNGVQRGLGLAI